MDLYTAENLPSLCPRVERESNVVGVGLVQTKWHEDPEEHRSVLAAGIIQASLAGARIVFLQELTMLRYMADVRPNPSARSAMAESLEDGPSITFFREQACAHNVYIAGSVFEKTGADSERGYNTAVLVAPDGTLVQRTRKMHIPITAGYYEDEYFAPGPADDNTAENPYPVVTLPIEGEPHLGLPTCWDEWFPETARMYGMQGAQILSYPTAIGSEPDYPDFDTEPLWEQTIRANGIANGTFMVVPNRYGNEGKVTFYGSSFISDPFGRVLVQAPRDRDAVLVAHLDLAQRDDWITLFPFYKTRRPESYERLLRREGLGA